MKLIENKYIFCPNFGLQRFVSPVSLHRANNTIICVACLSEIITTDGIITTGGIDPAITFYH